MRLWGIAELPFWPALNGSWSSPISVCWRLRTSVAKRSSDPPTMAIAARSAACRSRCTIWVLTGSACSPSEARTSASIDGSRWLYVPTGPEILPVPISSTAAASRRAAAIELEGPAGELEAERRRLGVDRVGPAHHHRVRPRARARAMSAARRRSASSSRRSPAARSWSASPCRRRRCWSGPGAGTGPRARRSPRPG